MHMHWSSLKTFVEQIPTCAGNISKDLFRLSAVLSLTLSRISWVKTIDCTKDLHFNQFRHYCIWRLICKGSALIFITKIIEIERSKNNYQKTEFETLKSENFMRVKTQITEKEIGKDLKQVKNKKLPAPEGISPELTKYGSQKLHQMTQQNIFQRVINGNNGQKNGERRT